MKFWEHEVMSDRNHIPLAPSAALTVETVTSVRHWNEHLFSFTITRPQSFRFRSGEFVMLGLPGDGRPLLRAYSIASPAYAEELEFLSIKVPDGPLTSRLQKIEPGDQIFLGRKPTGTLVTDALLPGKRLFFLTTGTGLAPFLSLARDPDVYDKFNQILPVHSVRRVSDLAFRTELEAQLAGDPLEQRLILHQRVAGELGLELGAESEVADAADRVDQQDLVEHVIDIGVAREAEERREAGAGRQEEQPLARQ